MSHTLAELDEMYDKLGLASHILNTTWPILRMLALLKEGLPDLDSYDCPLFHHFSALRAFHGSLMELVSTWQEQINGGQPPAALLQERANEAARLLQEVPKDASRYFNKCPLALISAAMIQNVDRRDILVDPLRDIIRQIPLRTLLSTEWPVLDLLDILHTDFAQRNMSASHDLDDAADECLNIWTADKRKTSPQETPSFVAQRLVRPSVANDSCFIMDSLPLNQRQSIGREAARNTTETCQSALSSHASSFANGRAYNESVATQENGAYIRRSASDGQDVSGQLSVDMLEWIRYMHVRLFDRYWSAGYITRDSHALSIGASTGEEVRALYQAGVRYAIGVDLVERPPLVVRGDLHDLPFKDDSFDFVFAKVFNRIDCTFHYAAEVERVLRPNGYAAFLLPSGTYRPFGSSSAVKLPPNRTEAVAAFLRLFQCSQLVDIHDVIPVMQQPDCSPEGLFGPMWGVVLRKGKEGGNDCWMWCRHADALDSCSAQVRHLEGREIGEKRSGTTMPASTGWLSSDLLSSVANADGTIVMTTVNNGMVDFAINWAKSLQRQGASSFLIVCLDDGCFDLLSQSLPNNVVRAPKEVRVSAAATIFNTESFGALVMTRPFFVREILQRGYTVLYNDVDMVWLRNALEYMPSRRFDVALQIDVVNFCSCLMLFRPTEGALSLLNQWEQLMHRETRRNITYNNPYLKEAVKNLRNSVSIASLSPAFFPSG
ncbi:unnamed protein product [Vitrella brassicaformis CCMP3155]|uniref:Methyltransferase type 11 domain-containing protein n=1 Tax=Vitrella brassicaformis (strain CCMP3155) TaxID=1169540 RepID=A0A0G4EL57_VITBC|nr:unnamed protein product [Vitrella brassicaformis CCMP3155]|eukprot:CEL97126.1 unnamed protein product [Vitrella brassicaformis CCMP3155]